MANTIGTPTIIDARGQFQGFFERMWAIKATVTDNDAITATDTVSMAITVPGVALGDVVVAFSITNDLSDGTDQAIMQCYVTAADTVVVRFTADVGAYADNDLNNAVVRILIGRPTW